MAEKPFAPVTSENPIYRTYEDCEVSVSMMSFSPRSLAGGPDRLVALRCGVWALLHPEVPVGPADT